MYKHLKNMAFKRRFNYCCRVIALVWLFYSLISCQGKTPPNDYTTYSFVVPRNNKPNDPATYILSTKWIEDIIRKKKQIKITLDEDRITNQKKIALIRYEARKLKYTQDTTTIIRVNLTDETTYGELLQLIKLCNEDKHKRYALLKRSFVIFGEPSSKKVSEKPILDSLLIL
jgi:hypothetical protein